MSSRNCALISNLCIKGKVDLHLLLEFYRINQDIHNLIRISIITKNKKKTLDTIIYHRGSSVLVLSADDMLNSNPNGL
jgi:hypothetical protein